MSAVASEFVTQVRAMELEDIKHVAVIEREAYDFSVDRGDFFVIA